MKHFTFGSALLTLASLAYAAPGSAIKAREFEAGITFIGAGPNPPTYSQSFPTDDNVYPINNPLSVSKIQSAGGAICNFFGANGSVTFLHDEETVDVGPPQPQVSGVCDVA